MFAKGDRPPVAIGRDVSDGENGMGGAVTFFLTRKIGDIADKIKAERMSKGFAVASERWNGAGVAGASTFNDTADIACALIPLIKLKVII